MRLAPTPQIKVATAKTEPKVEVRLEAKSKPVEPPKPETVQVTAPVVETPTVAPTQPTGTCAEWMQAAGVTDEVNAAELIRRESGCNPNAVNASSGACGIPQALPCSQLGTSDPVQQIKWMQDYVVRRYGSWAGAVQFHNRMGWY